MGRFEPTGPVDVPGLEHSVANLAWGLLRGALGVSDGSAGAASNVPSALGVLRHAELYRGVPEEIEDAFAVLERHCMRDGRLYPVAIATLPFLFDILRRNSPLGERIADLVARYASCGDSLDDDHRARFARLLADLAGDAIRWFGHYDRALGALAIHVPALREAYLAAVEGAERVAPEVLLALVELDAAPGDTRAMAAEMLERADAAHARMCAAAFLARFGPPTPDVRARIAALLPPTAALTLSRFVRGLWQPQIGRPVVAPQLYDARVMFTGKQLVIVKAGERTVTLPWVGAELEAGDPLQVGLSIHGEPKLAVVTDRRGNVRVIDFDPS